MSSSKTFTFLENTNIREGIAVHGNGKIIGQMYKDSKIELETPPVEGLLHEEEVLGQWQQSNKWYLDANGWYYWEKAVKKIESPLWGIFNFSKEIPFDKNFNSRIKVNPETSAGFEKIMQTGGKGVKLAIIDKYLVRDHPVLKFQQPEKWINCNLSGSDVNQDVWGASTHGSSCASIAVSRPFGNFPCLGVSPLVDFYFFSIGKRAHSTQNIDPWEAMIKALDLAINKYKVDIISISQGLYDSSPYFSKIVNLFALAKNKKILTFCSGGRIFNPHMSLLALNENTIGVEAIPNINSNINGIEFYFLEKKVSLWNSKKKMFRPGKILSSSFATPLLAGLFANLLSFERQLRNLPNFKFSFKEVKNQIKPYSMNAHLNSINSNDQSLYLLNKL
jgi:hypothetical protein